MKFPAQTSAMINISAVTGCAQPTGIFAYLILCVGRYLMPTCLIYSIPIQYIGFSRGSNCVGTSSRYPRMYVGK